MASSSSSSSSVNMPEDVVFSILLWLPVVSLLRFKSVCRSWRSLIQSPDFITQHLFHSRNHHHLILLNPGRKLFEKSSKWSYVGLFSSSSDDDHQFELLDFPLHFDACHELWLLHLVASCHGIVCLHHEDDGNVYLWNPATKQFRHLPEPHAPWIGNWATCDFPIGIGFGFDHKTNDYKVVRFFLPRYANSYKFRLDIYTLGSDSWRVVEDVDYPLLPTEPSIGSAPILQDHNGMLFWLISGSTPSSGPAQTVLSFHITNEDLRTVPLPDSLINSDSFCMELAILKETLACIHMVNRSSSTMAREYFEIWILNEFGLKDSWTKLHIIGPFSIVKWMMEFPKNGELLFLECGQLLLCEPSTHQVKSLPVQQHSSDLQAVVYKESLVSIKRA